MIEQEINNSQQIQYQHINVMENNSKNGNINMYTHNNPTLKGYQPSNGSHSTRSKQLRQPNSFVSGMLAHEVNAFGRHMLPYDHGGKNNNGNNKNNNTEDKMLRKPV